MHVPRLAILLSFSLLIVGCGGGQQATVSYNSSSNRTTYQTRSYTVSSISGANFASSKSITMRAVARCQGTNCTPNQVQLVFSASGNQQLSLSGVDGQLVANGTRITWSSAEASKGLGPVSEDRALNVIGTFASVDLELKQLRTLATATSIKGSIGGQSLNISSGVQSGLQELLRKIPQS